MGRLRRLRGVKSTATQWYREALPHIRCDDVAVCQGVSKDYTWEDVGELGQRHLANASIAAMCLRQAACRSHLAKARDRRVVSAEAVDFSAKGCSRGLFRLRTGYEQGPTWPVSRLLDHPQPRHEGIGLASGPCGPTGRPARRRCGRRQRRRLAAVPWRRRCWAPAP